MRQLTALKGYLMENNDFTLLAMVRNIFDEDVPLIVISGMLYKYDVKRNILIKVKIDV